MANLNTKSIFLWHLLNMLFVGIASGIVHHISTEVES